MRHALAACGLLLILLFGCCTTTAPPGDGASGGVGCQYDSPPCDENYECVANECMLKEGCEYDNPPCEEGLFCDDNTCILKEGCQYDNPPCEEDYRCLNNKCVLKEGCEYDNPPCEENFICTENKCVPGEGCLYENPKCEPNNECIENRCELKKGCFYGNPPCTGGEVCEDNECVEERLYCGIDNSACEPDGQCIGSICTRVDMITGAGEAVVKVAVSPEYDNILLAHSYDRDSDTWTIYYSGDSGSSWSPAIDANVFDIDKVNPTFVYAAAQSNVYRSENYGRDFETVGTFESGVYPASLFTDRFNSGKLYIGHHNTPDRWGLYVSEDRGESFDYIPFADSVDVPPADEEITQNRIIWAINQDPQDENIIYVTGEDGSHKRYMGYPHSDPYYTLRTRDGGTSWEPISDGLTWHSIGIWSFVNISSGETKWLSGEEGGGPYLLSSAGTWDPITPAARTDPSECVIWGGMGSIQDFKVSPENNSVYFLLSKSSLFVAEGSQTRCWNRIYYNGDAWLSSMSFDSDGNLYLSDFGGGIMKIYNFLDLDI